MKDDFLQIDRSRLDDEWVDQPRLYFEYAQELANAKGKLEEAKAELELIRAELARAVRDDPGKFGLVKPTVDAVASTVLEQQEYQDATADVNGLRHDVDVLGAAVTALDHRKRALENLVALHGQQYWSAPRAKEEDVREAMHEVEKAKAASRTPPRSKK